MLPFLTLRGSKLNVDKSEIEILFDREAGLRGAVEIEFTHHWLISTLNRTTLAPPSKLDLKIQADITVK